ncbi:glycosyltransferase family 2 protein [Cyanobium gracile]|uniref:Glycosyl transferase n=1 Tax=Cyanobium gracile (strain ATCC 27147 / PCC 6307) TaxID=292564 RepID=K9P3K2_CYAGP|nr:glycosyltransferase family A protein [Cyanobium gracile]AFY27558.1 glycosyl transferase [Cyanobium gracile PCC 6307]
MGIPAVSVIIPAYNAAGSLAETVASVQAQTWTDWEALIIDDGSSDGTAALVRDLQAEDARIRLLCVANGGVSAARNRGVAGTHASLIAFLDADDLWYPAKLRLHLDHFRGDAALGVSFDRVAFLTPSGLPTGQHSRSRLRQLAPEHFLYENPTTTTSTWVVRRTVFDQVGGFHPQMSYSEDLEWLLRVRCAGWRIAGLEQVLTGYRTSEGGLSSDLLRMEAGWERLVEQARPYAPELVEAHLSRARAVHLRYLARRSLRLNASATGLGVGFMNQALRSDPWLLLRQPRRTWLTLAAVQLRRLWRQARPLLPPWRRSR